MKPYNDRFLKACRAEVVDRTPIWLMRQAGRYMPEYRQLREKHAMLDVCRDAELSAHVTMMPLERYELDAAILFSDITMPFFGMGVGFELKTGVGPVIEQPLRTVADVKKLKLFESEQELPFIREAIQILRRKLHVPLIGFAGAPFTLAAYMIEGHPTRDFKNTRAFMYSQPEAWHALMEVLAQNTLNYLSMQARAGAQALQIFDSWVGGLHPDVYREYLLPHMRYIFDGLSCFDIPVIHFGTGTACLLEIMHEAGGDVMGIDWRTPLDWAWQKFDYSVPIQGNLDPAVLLGPQDQLEQETKKILDETQGRNGFIFNLGHGVLPGTDPENVSRLIDIVHSYEHRTK